ncbi:ribonuclease domain-containing protein [Catellatospora methionotrophica]|uniref:ribonuclease domain-containing protein n=1 Tax=Catellatospora methionotrophica TaxID=121620 RepID=UPI001EF281D1|nr:ribonuclease domain-containing protein [Catellatospora methionotrophica]
MDRIGTRRDIVITAVVAVLVIALMALVGYCARTAMAPSGDGAPVPSAAAGTPVSGLPTVPLRGLPKEAVATVALIDKNGPYPYDKDGTVFGNLEGVLPKQPRGYYREFTVPTPGSRDRGARRLVAGRDGDLYYTDDHYESFRQVLR